MYVTMTSEKYIFIIYFCRKAHFNGIYPKTKLIIMIKK